MSDTPTSTPEAPAAAAAAPNPESTKATSPAEASEKAKASVAKQTKVSDAFSEIDALFNEEKPAAPAKPAKAKKPAESKPAEPDHEFLELGRAKSIEAEDPGEEKPKKSEDKPGDEPGDTDDSAEDGKGSRKEANETLRRAYESAKKRVEELERKLAAPREDDPERKALVERLEAREKRLQQMQEELEFAAFERSDKYKEQYEAPLISAWQGAVKEIEGLEVVTADGETRAANVEDLKLIVGMSTKDATTAAKEMFGDVASEVLAIRRKLVELNDARFRAIDEYRRKGGEIEKERVARHAQNREKVAKIWAESNDQAAKKYPKLFAPEEGDDKGNELLAKGFEMADLAFSGFDKMPPEEMARLHSAIRMKAAGFDRMVHRTRKAEARIKELEAELDEFKKSEPQPGEAARTKPETKKGWAEEIDDLAR